MECLGQQTLLRRVVTGKTDLPADARDANRGALSPQEGRTLQALKTYTAFARIFQARKRFPQIATSFPTRCGNFPPDIYAGQYALERGALQIFINLGQESIRLPVPLNATVELSLNDAEKNEDWLALPAAAAAWIRIPDSAPVCLLE